MQHDFAGKDGVTLRQHLKQAGRAVEDPEPPEAVEHVLEWFFELSRARSSNGFGVNPISHLEIQAWAGLYGIRLASHEMRMLAAMDAVFCAEVAAMAGKD